MKRTHKSPFIPSGEVEFGRSGKYPKKLLDECILVFKDEDDVCLSEEEAGQILDSLGGLFLAFASKGNERAGGTHLSADAGSRSLGVSNTEGTLPNAT